MIGIIDIKIIDITIDLNNKEKSINPEVNFFICASNKLKLNLKTLP
jgi:hypothetical protein